MILRHRDSSPDKPSAQEAKFKEARSKPGAHTQEISLTQANEARQGAGTHPKTK